MFLHCSSAAGTIDYGLLFVFLKSTTLTHLRRLFRLLFQHFYFLFLVNTFCCLVCGKNELRQYMKLVIPISRIGNQQ